MSHALERGRKRNPRIALIASSIAGALAISGGIAAVTQFGGHESDPEAIDCSQLEADTYRDASAVAQACQSDVEVLLERTPWETSWATADGQSRLEISSSPTRVEVGGEWVPLDQSIVPTSDATALSVAAPVYPMDFNPGGNAGRGEPLASIEREGRTLDVWFPLELPVPTVDGARATYDLAGGVRLHVSVGVDGTGFLPVVELATPAAAELFVELLDASRDASSVSTGSQIEFATESGLEIVLDDHNAAHFVDAAQNEHFFVAPPVMWDSSGQTVELAASVTEVGETDRTRAPAGGDRIVAMDMEAVGETLVVSPDDSMLSDSDTVWPVFLDPSFDGKSSTERVAIRTGGYTNTLYNWGDISSSMLGQGTGYCSQVSSCNVQFKQRLVWEYTGLTGIRDLEGADITSAKFRVYGAHSYNCTPRETRLYRTSAISGNSTYSSVDWIDEIGARTEAHSVNCGGTGYKEFNALDGLRWIADNDKSSIALGLVVTQTSMDYWKRFRHNATIEVTWNRAPDVPTGHVIGTQSQPECGPEMQSLAFADSTPSFAVLMSDPDEADEVEPLKANFQVVSGDPYPTTEPTSVIWESGYTTPNTNGAATATVPTGSELADGTTFAWRALVSDGTRVSDWSAWCLFTVDVTSPPTPTIEPVADGFDTVYVAGAESGGVGQSGGFTFARGASSDATRFYFGFDDPANPNDVAVEPDGTALVPFNPSGGGPVILTVKARDAAGNWSPEAEYTFTVAAPTEDVIWMLDEATGAIATAESGEPAPELAISGATWATGPHDLFESREGDAALDFDGIDDAATTTSRVVNTTESFAISTYVRLDDSVPLGAASYTAISQDAASAPAFTLGYSDECVALAEGCWTFRMVDDPTGSGSVVVESDVAVERGEWVHLLAEHDVDDGELRLWVCEIGTPSQPSAGSPVESSEARAATPWVSPGAFALGRGSTAGVPGDWWPGQIDNVRVFTGEVVDNAKIRRLCSGAEAADFGDGHDALDPTVAVAP